MNSILTQLSNIAENALDLSKKTGASDAAVSVGVEEGFHVSARMGEVDRLEHHREKHLSLTVYFGEHKGDVSISDTSDDAIEEAVKKACNIARFTQADTCHGLADEKFLAKNIPDLNLYHPWSLTPEEAIKQAIEAEKKARSLDKRLTNSDGVDISTHETFAVSANTRGFFAAVPGTYHSLGCSLLAEEKGEMERGHRHVAARDAAVLPTLMEVAKIAAEKTLAQLGARKIKTCKLPVIFHYDVSRSLIGHFLSAISGHNLYKQSSFLLNSLNKNIFPAFINLEERPLLPGEIASSAFDADGVTTGNKYIVEKGAVNSYLLDVYAARRLSLTPTGNANGVHNLFLNAQVESLNDLLKQMGKGLLVTSLMGQGVNIVTGDYSRGVSGFWVEHGEIQYPVSEITIAGNLADIYQRIIAVANDAEPYSNVRSGSLLVEQMTIAGS